MNLRGVRESGAFFAVPTYLFMVAILGMCAYGLMRLLAGDLPEAESADAADRARSPGGRSRSPRSRLMFLLARAFSSGCAALTGVEAISNGVPAFRKPKSRNAATTLLLLGLIAISMMMSVIVLANQMAIRFVDPHELDRLRTAAGDALPDGYEQHPVIAQIAAGVFDHFPPGFYFVRHRHRRSSSCWRPTPPSTASRCSARSSPRTAWRPARSARAATGSPTATASSSSRPCRSC